MSFTELRAQLAGGPRAIEWQQSGIVEMARIAKNGAVIVTNVVTRKSYCIPKKYNELNIKVLSRDSLIQLGKLLPKNFRGAGAYGSALQRKYVGRG